jgi:O-antigen ligase
MQSDDSAPGSPLLDAGRLIVLLGSLLPPLVFFINRAPTMAMAIAAVGGTILLGRQGQWPVHPPRPLLWLLCATVLWATMSAWWAPDVMLGLLGAGKLAANLAGGMLLIGVAHRVAPAARRWLPVGLALGIGSVAMILGIEAISGAPLSEYLHNPIPNLNYNRQIQIYGMFWLNAPMAVTALMAWPLLLSWPNMHPLFGAAIIIILAAISAHIGFWAGTLALVAGGTAALLVGRFGKKVGKVLSAGAIVFVLAAPVAPHTILKPEVLGGMVEIVPLSVLPRFYIWSFAADRIAEKPVLGWGMNAARNIPGGHVRIYDNTRSQIFGELMPLHPHNASLQVWLELGFPGALLLAGFFAWVLRQGSAMGGGSGGRAAASAAGLCVTASVFLGLSYGIWQSWWLAAMFIAAALTVAAGSGAPRR